MRYIVINKLTNNLVEKIIFPEGGFKPSREMFPSYLDVIEDKNDIVQNFNMRFDEESQSFVELTENYISTKSYESLFEENEKLKLAIAEVSEEKEQEILKLKLALAEIVEGKGV